MSHIFHLYDLSFALFGAIFASLVLTDYAAALKFKLHKKKKRKKRKPNGPVKGDVAEAGQPEWPVDARESSAARESRVPPLDPPGDAWWHGYDHEPPRSWFGLVFVVVGAATVSLLVLNIVFATTIKHPTPEEANLLNGLGEWWRIGMGTIFGLLGGRLSN